MCPQFIAMGMTYEQFWDEPPRIATAYQKAYKLKLESQNELAWLIGLYVYDAVAVVVSNALSRKGAKPKNYLERPMDIFPLTEKEKKRREREEYEKMDRQLQAIRNAQQRKKKKQK